MASQRSYEVDRQNIVNEASLQTTAEGMEALHALPRDRAVVPATGTISDLAGPEPDRLFP